MGARIPIKIPSTCPKCKQPTQELLPFCSRCSFDLRHHSYVARTGQCIYCNASSLVQNGKSANNVPLTKEHAFGRWLAAKYPSVDPRPMVQRIQRPDVLETFAKSPPKMHFRDIERKEGNYQLKVRNVCEVCNNGWMSRLHIEAKGIVQELADGYWRKLTPNELEVLSRWAVMVSINLECHARQMTATKWQLVDLMQGKMPKGWRVYIGHLPSNKHANFNHTRVVGADVRIEDDHLKITNTAFCIEHVIFNTVSANGGDILLESAKYFAVSLQQPNPLTCVWSRHTQELPETIAKVDDTIFRFIFSF